MLTNSESNMTVIPNIVTIFNPDKTVLIFKFLGSSQHSEKKTHIGRQFL